MDRNRGTGNKSRHEYCSASDAGEELPTVRHGDFEQADWDMRFLRVWGRDDSGLVGWREHLPTIRAGFGPDDPEAVASAWHTGEFCLRYLPHPYSPVPEGIHWIGTRRSSHPDNREAELFPQDVDLRLHLVDAELVDHQGAVELPAQRRRGAYPG